MNHKILDVTSNHEQAPVHWSTSMASQCPESSLRLMNYMDLGVTSHYENGPVH